MPKSRFTIIVWDNAGVRTTHAGGDTIESALLVAKTYRVTANRTVKVGWMGNAMRHWSRSLHLAKNHWASRATADEVFL